MTQQHKERIAKSLANGIVEPIDKAVNKIIAITAIVMIAITIYTATKKNTYIKEIYVCKGSEVLHKSKITWRNNAKSDTCGWVMAKVVETAFTRDVMVYNQ